MLFGHWHLSLNLDHSHLLYTLNLKHRCTISGCYYARMVLLRQICLCVSLAPRWAIFRWNGVCHSLHLCRVIPRSLPLVAPPLVGCPPSLPPTKSTSSMSHICAPMFGSSFYFFLSFSFGVTPPRASSLWPNQPPQCLIFVPRCPDLSFVVNVCVCLLSFC